MYDRNNSINPFFPRLSQTDGQPSPDATPNDGYGYLDLLQSNYCPIAPTTPAFMSRRERERVANRLSQTDGQPYANTTQVMNPNDGYGYDFRLLQSTYFHRSPTTPAFISRRERERAPNLQSEYCGSYDSSSSSLSQNGRLKLGDELSDFSQNTITTPAADEVQLHSSLPPVQIYKSNQNTRQGDPSFNLHSSKTILDSLERFDDEKEETEQQHLQADESFANTRPLDDIKDPHESRPIDQHPFSVINNSNETDRITDREFYEFYKRNKYSLPIKETQKQFRCDPFCFNRIMSTLNLAIDKSEDGFNKTQENNRKEILAKHHNLNFSKLHADIHRYVPPYLARMFFGDLTNFKLYLRSFEYTNEKGEKRCFTYLDLKAISVDKAKEILGEVRYNAPLDDETLQQLYDGLKKDYYARLEVQPQNTEMPTTIQVSEQQNRQQSMIDDHACASNHSTLFSHAGHRDEVQGHSLMQQTQSVVYPLPPVPTQTQPAAHLTTFRGQKRNPTINDPRRNDQDNKKSQVKRSRYI